MQWHVSCKYAPNPQQGRGYRPMSFEGKTFQRRQAKGKFLFVLKEDERKTRKEKE